MDEALQVILEMNEVVWTRLKRDLADVGPDEVNWRPVPEANTINLIVRHLRIDAAWHVMKIEHQDHHERQDSRTSSESPPLDFEANLRELDGLWSRLLGRLRESSFAELERQTEAAYRGSPQGAAPPRFLGYHLALHTTGHGAQIRTIRNLYRKTRGEPARFFPDNSTFPT